MTATLNRTTLGKLAAYGDTAHLIAGVVSAFSTSHWTAPTGVTLAISAGTGNSFRTTGAATGVVRHTAIAARETVMVQEVGKSITSGASFGPTVRSSNAVIASQSYQRGVQAAGFSAAEGAAEVVAGSTVQTDLGSAVTRANNTEFRATIAVDGTSCRVHIHADSVTRSLTLAGVTSGHGGTYHSRGSAGSADRTERYEMAGAYVTVVGPAGVPFRAQIKNAGGTILAYADAVGGTAAIDTLTVIYPTAVTLEILDTLGGMAVLVSATPTERLWGGDVWVLADVAPRPVGFALALTFSPVNAPRATFSIGLLFTPVVGFVERVTLREDDPRVWRRRTGYVVESFSVAPLSTLAEERLLTLAGEFLETL